MYTAAIGTGFTVPLLIPNVGVQWLFFLLKFIFKALSKHWLYLCRNKQHPTVQNQTANTAYSGHLSVNISRRIGKYGPSFSSNTAMY